MKIIDLLNKIANGEEVPKKIKINNFIYEYRDYMYCTEKANYQDIEDYLFGKWNFNILNNEVEILEEEKKIPEKLSTWYSVEVKQSDEENIEYANYNFETMYKKINEIIDYLKSKGDE